MRATLSTAETVWKQASAFLLQLHGEAGPAVEKLLPRTLNPKIKEQLEAAMKPPKSLPCPSESASTVNLQSGNIKVDEVDEGHDRELSLGAQSMYQQQGGEYTQKKWTSESYSTKHLSCSLQAHSKDMRIAPLQNKNCAGWLQKLTVVAPFFSLFGFTIINFKHNSRLLLSCSSHTVAGDYEAPWCLQGKHPPDVGMQATLCFCKKLRSLH